MNIRKYDKKLSYKTDEFNSPDDVLDQERIEEVNEDESEEEEEDPFDSEEDDEIIEKFKKNLATMDSHWNDIYAKCEEDWDIYNLDQWSEDGKRKRGKRPIITMDICRKFVKTVVAETFRNPPGGANPSWRRFGREISISSC